MACSVVADLKIIIQCDREMIRTYFFAYVLIATAALGIAGYLLSSSHADSLFAKLTEGAITSLAIPFVLQHMKRKNALTPLLVMLSRGQECSPSDAQCVELKALVDQELQRRLSVVNGNIQS